MIASPIVQVNEAYEVARGLMAGVNYCGSKSLFHESGNKCAKCIQSAVESVIGRAGTQVFEPPLPPPLLGQASEDWLAFALTIVVAGGLAAYCAWLFNALA